MLKTKTKSIFMKYSIKHVETAYYKIYRLIFGNFNRLIILA